MPTVQLYGNGLPQVGPQPAPDVQRSGAPSPAALGGELGQSLEQVGSQAVTETFRVQEAAKLQADQIAALKAESDLAGWQTHYFYDTKTGVVAKQGAETFGLPETALADFEKQA